MRHRAPSEQFAAWLITGPVGHLAAALVDLSAMAWIVGRAKLSRRA
jgi:hypothetical protein